MITTKNLLVYPVLGLVCFFTMNTALKWFDYMQYLREEAPDCFQPTPHRFQIALGTVFGVALIHPIIMKAANQLFMTYLPYKKFPKDSKPRRDKAHMMAERVYKIFIYSSTTTMLYWILKSAPFLHSSLGGESEDPQYFTNFPCMVDMPPYLGHFYVLKLSYHFYELMFTVVFHSNRADFPEYVLHHFLTWILIAFAYCFNYYSIGAVTMFVHDFSDIFVSVLKLTSDVTSFTTQHTAYAMMVGTWVYFRLWFFPKLIIMKYYEQAYQLEHYVIKNIFSITFGFLLVLEALHVWWFIVMIKIFIRRVKRPDRIAYGSNENTAQN